MRYADLHTHTHHSDGTRSSREAIDVARASGIEILSISDHDNLAAYFESKAYADSREVQLIAGVELSCAYEGFDIHILAYAFDPLDERVEKRLQSFRATRADRGKRMVAKLGELGYRIDHDRVEELAAGGAMGRPHVARALVERGYVKNVSEAFDRFIGHGKPAYVEKERFQIPEAVELIHSAGGLLSIAHPTLYQHHERIVTQLLDAGIDAIEVLHPDVDPPSREMYINLARFRGKFTTGGSDDHGTVKEKQTLGTVRVPETMIKPILDRL